MPPSALNNCLSPGWNSFAAGLVDQFDGAQALTLHRQGRAKDGAGDEPGLCIDQGAENGDRTWRPLTMVATFCATTRPTTPWPRARRSPGDIDRADAGMADQIARSRHRPGKDWPPRASMKAATLRKPRRRVSWRSREAANS